MVRRRKYNKTTIMNTKHVPDLELCQEFDRLCKEKGIVVPETLFVWVCDPKLENWHPVYKDKMKKGRWPDCFPIPAPLVSELGELLPNERKDKLAFFSGLAINGWFCEIKNYQVMPYERFHVILQEVTEANARMKCLNYLIAEGIITTL